MKSNDEDVYKYKGVIRRVVDGDTIIVDINLGFDFHFFNQRIRLFGINAPDVKAEKGLEASEFLKQYEGFECRINTMKDTKGRYGRYLAIVFILINDNFCNINDLLVEKGYAVYYDVRNYNKRGESP